MKKEPKLKIDDRGLGGYCIGWYFPSEKTHGIGDGFGLMLGTWFPEEMEDEKAAREAIEVYPAIHPVDLKAEEWVWESRAVAQSALRVAKEAIQNHRRGVRKIREVPLTMLMSDRPEPELSPELAKASKVYGAAVVRSIRAEEAFRACTVRPVDPAISKEFQEASNARGDAFVEFMAIAEQEAKRIK